MPHPPPQYYLTSHYPPPQYYLTSHHYPPPHHLPSLPSSPVLSHVPSLPLLPSTVPPPHHHPSSPVPPLLPIITPPPHAAMLACGGTVSANSDVILISCQASFTPNIYNISENGTTLGNGNKPYMHSTCSHCSSHSSSSPGLPPYTLSVLTLDPGVHTFVITAANDVTGTSAASRVSITVPGEHICTCTW